MGKMSESGEYTPVQDENILVPPLLRFYTTPDKLDDNITTISIKTPPEFPTPMMTLDYYYNSEDDNQIINIFVSMEQKLINKWTKLSN